MKTEAATVPVSDRITRERTYELIAKRDDKLDAFGQMVMTLQDLVQKDFIGRIVLNCNGSGSVASIQVTETTKVQ